MSHDNPLVGGAAELLNRPLFAELEFFEPSLADAAPEHLYAPEVVEDELIPQLETNRLILLAGRRETEKLLFAKQLAWHLKNKQSGTLDLAVRQWQPSTSVVHVSSALDRAKEPSIFLFPGLEPHHLGGYDLSRFQYQLGTRHYAILTTHSSPDRWDITPELAKALWVDIDRRLLTNAFLTEELVLRLAEMDEKLPQGLAWTPTEPSCPTLIGSLSVSQVAAKLESPTNIRSFVVALATLSEAKETSVRDLLGKLADERLAVHHWYRSLTKRDQVLALGLALFDGLLDDQVFSSLEILMQEAWRDWDPSLANFDYHELGRMAPYFRGLEQSQQTVRIECCSDAYRRYLLEIAWVLHRRRMCAVLPVLEYLARQSPGRPRPSRRLAEATGPMRSEKPVEASAEEANETGEVESAPEEKAEDDVREDARANELTESEVAASRWIRTGRWRDLFGNNLRNGLTRDRLANTVSEIGRLSTDAVEPTLIQLASYATASTQHIAADAMARWRDLDPGGEGNRRLSRMLSSWRSESFAKELAQWRRTTSSTKTYPRIRATIALTLSQASLYDPPNQLDSDLISLFSKLLRDRSPEVGWRLHEDTVPLLIQSHLKQLIDIVWDEIVPRQDLLMSAAVGMARAHYLRPAEAKPILERWLEKARRIEARDRQRRWKRNNALALIAYAYGLMPFGIDGQDRGGFRVEEIFRTLRRLLAEEHAQSVRSAVLVALLLQASSNFGAVAPHVQATVGELTPDERKLVVNQMIGLYLEQRRRLEMTAEPRGSTSEPDEYRMLNGVMYGLWIESPRPFTKVEKLLRTWLRDSKRPLALQLAVKCFGGFAQTKLESRERELRERDPTPETPVPIAEEAPEPLRKVELRRLSFLSYLATFVASLTNAERRRILQAALPEVLHCTGRLRPSRVRLFLDLWNRGKPQWHRLRETETWRDLARVPDKESLLLIQRIGSCDERLARDLYKAVWIHGLRWPLVGLVLIIGLLLLAVAGTL